MNKKRLILLLVLIMLILVGGILAIRLISGAFKLLGGVVDAVVGVVLILALVALVAWMFAYAKKKRKK